MAAAVDLPMPKLGDTVTEGTVIVWLVSVGDVVTEGQALAEITTDKVTTDYPSPCSGTVLALLLDIDETVPVGTPMVRIETDDLVDDSASPPSTLETAGLEALRATGAGAGDCDGGRRRCRSDTRHGQTRTSARSGRDRGSGSARADGSDAALDGTAHGAVLAKRCARGRAHARRCR